MRDFIKRQNSNVWRWSLEAARTMATLPLRSLPTGLLKQIGSAIEQQIDQGIDVTRRAGDTLQNKMVDLMFDVATFKPLQDAAEDAGLLNNGLGDGQQAQPDLDFMKVANDTVPGTTGVMLPMIVLYSSLKRYDEGIARLESYFTKFNLTAQQKALNLAGLALLRSAKAKELAPWQLTEQYTLIQRTLENLKEAKRLTENDPDYTTSYEKLFAVWTSGILLAQLPWPFGDPDTALADLKWCERTIYSSFQARETTYLFLRQVHYARAILARNAGDEQEAQKYLKASGYKEFSPDNLFIATIFASTSDGVRDGVRQVKETVPGQGFTLTGFDLSDYNFFVTDDGKQLIAVDSGSRTDNCETAYRAFEAYYNKNYKRAVPPLTTCFMTHCHWDHTGGHLFFKTLNPDVVFYSRSEYVLETERAHNQPPPWSWTLGETFTTDTITAYKPQKEVDGDWEVTIGGTKVRLIMLPGGGGETPDGMLVYFHEHGLLLCGDFIVPWVGSPYVVEGDPDALLVSIELVTKLRPQPKFFLSGHWAVNQFFPTMDVLARLLPRLQWLKAEVINHIYDRKNRPEIQKMNLTPPDLPASGEADVQIPYVAMREVFIDRIYDQKVGYWGPQLQNVDYLDDTDMGAVFRRYLGLSDVDVARAIDKMITAGDFELAGQVANWALTQYPESDTLKDAQRNAFRQLKQKWQLLNVFKFMMYSQVSDEPTPQAPEQPVQ